jgi:hypothetical protein
MQSGYWPDISATRSRIKGKELCATWGEFLGRLPWELFVTLTFDPYRVPSVDQQLASKEGQWWCGQTARLVRRPIAWVVAPERGRCGRWHAHAMLIGLQGELGQAPEAMWRQRNGQIKVRTVTEYHGLALYTTKSAALTGEIELSDTLSRYRALLGDGPLVDLYSPDRSFRNGGT